MHSYYPPKEFLVAVMAFDLNSYWSDEKVRDENKRRIWPQ
jgi:hypothetical protein